jgi:hypothetical protein
MECPCEKCLVRATCNKHLIRKSIHNTKYLIVELAEKCPLIRDYFGQHQDGRTIHDYKKIYCMCRIHGATKETSFLWFENEIQIA